jgi:hypothetical protein
MISGSLFKFSKDLIKSSVGIELAAPENNRDKTVSQ